MTILPIRLGPVSLAGTTSGFSSTVSTGRNGMLDFFYSRVPHPHPHPRQSLSIERPGIGNSQKPTQTSSALLFLINGLYFADMFGIALSYAGINSSMLHYAKVAEDMVYDADIRFDRLPQVTGGAIFANDLVSQFVTDEYQEFLSDLSDILEKNESTDKKHSLWEITLRHTKGNRNQALFWLALLTEDLDAAMHAKYLQSTLGPEWTESISRFEKVITALSKSNNMTLYPPEVNIDRKACYHFYVIAYWTLRLAEKHPNSKMAAFLPFGVNTSYEFMLGFGNAEILTKYANDKEYLKYFWQLIKENLNGVKPFEIGKYPNEEQDVYLGYAAYLYAKGMESEILPLDEFLRSFSKDPEQFMRRFL